MHNKKWYLRPGPYEATLVQWWSICLWSQCGTQMSRNVHGNGSNVTNLKWKTRNGISRTRSEDKYFWRRFVYVMQQAVLSVVKKKTKWGLFIKSSRAKRWGTPKSARNIECIVLAVKWMSSVPSTESFSVQTSRVAGRLLFFSSRAQVWHFQVAQKLCRSWLHEEKGKVNRQFLGRLEGSMVAEYTSSYVFAGSTSATQTGPLRVKEKPCHGLQRTVAKGRNFESSCSGRASKVHQETFCSIRAFALCKFAGWPVYETLGLETFLKLRFFFQGHQAGLGAVDPIFDGLEHCGQRKLQLSYPWRSNPRPWRQRRWSSKCHIGARMTIAGCGWNCYSRDCEWVYHRMTIALASENGDSWQCEWTQSHKHKNLRVKIATHGIANKLNRMMSTIACLECHRSEDWDVLYMRLRASTLLSRYWCGVCDWNMQSSETVWCECRKSRSWSEKCDWKFFLTKQALEVLRGPLVTMLARYMRLKIDIFSTNFKEIFRARLVTLLAVWHQI